MKFSLTYNDRELQRYLKKMLKKTDNLSPFMRETGAIVATSVKKNFEVGGRYSAVGRLRGGSKKWQPLSVATLFSGPKKKIVGKRGRFKKSFQKRLGNRKTLFGQGRLFGSIKFQAKKNEVRIGPDNLPYSAIHQFGGKAGRGLKVKIPARPYLVIQNEDNIEILRAAKRHFQKR